MSNVAKKTKSNVQDQDFVRFNLYLPKQAFEALEKLQEMSGKRSLAETVRAALRLYSVVQEGIGEGKEIMLYDRQTKEKERLITV